MVKKFLSAAVLAAILTAGTAFADAPEFKLGVTGGFQYTGDFLSINASDSGNVIAPDMQIKNNTNYLGGWVGFDATYAELGVSIFGGTTKTSRKVGDGDASDPEDSLKPTYLGISLLGKYPIAIGEKLVIAPTAGIVYNILLGAKDDEGEKIEFDGDLLKKEDYNSLGFRVGATVDFALTNSLAIRGGLLYAFRLANTHEADEKEMLENMGYTVKAFPNGPEIKVGIVYKF